MQTKTVKNKSQQSLNIAIDSLEKEGWQIASNQYRETDKCGNILFCIEMVKEEVQYNYQI